MGDQTFGIRSTSSPASRDASIPDQHGAPLPSRVGDYFVVVEYAALGETARR